MSAVTVFISYSHDTLEHEEQVLALADALRSHGVAAEIDQYEDWPEAGWPRWCEEQLRPAKSRFVLVICTKTYRERVENKTPADEGRGVFWEGGIIYDYLYGDKANKRFIPVLLSGATEDGIPQPLQRYPRYRLKAFDLKNDAGYEELYRELTNQPKVSRPTLGAIVPLPAREAQSRFSAPIPVDQGTISDLGWQHIDQKCLKLFFKSCTANDSAYKDLKMTNQDGVWNFLQKHGLASCVSNKYFLTEEGVLFCCNKKYIDKSSLHVAVELDWAELNKKQKRFEGPILSNFYDILHELRFFWQDLDTFGNPSSRDDLGSEIPVVDIPQRAIVEALANFLIHRDYREDDRGHINIYVDKLVFLNPGTSQFSREVLLNSKENLLPKYYRNNRIIDAMRIARINQQKGSGILSIRKALKDNGHVMHDGKIGLEIENDETNRRFKLVIFRRSADVFFKKKTLTTDAFHVDISRIIKYAPAELIGREDETKLLNDAWAKARNNETKRPHILTFVALGGEGKTSLVAKWAADLAYQNWPGCDAVFAWSFYSQGTREEAQSSSDTFLWEALTFFGDPAMAGSAQGAFEKGRRLAQLVGAQRALLILDGLEPLQYAPASPTPGELKDTGLAALLKGLAANNRGLCVVTTRYSITDLRAYWRTTAPEVSLLRLSKEAGVALLRSLGVKGAQLEFEALVEDAKGHALTLKLLGSYLRDAYAGDIRKRDQVKLGEADEEQGGHAFRMMDAYVHWFESGGENGQRALALLQLLGLFDRPADAGCLKAVWKAPLIPDLTEPLAGISEAQRNFAFTRLEDAKLLTVSRDTAGALLTLDAHPLLREYFAQQLRTWRPEAWRAAHRRLYDHLCATTKDKPEPTLEDLQPLYQAVAHGCQAGMQQDAYAKVFCERIKRPRQEFYSTKILGAFGSDLGAISCFFEQPWSRVSPAVVEADQPGLLLDAAFRLRALGRLTEALEPARASLAMSIEREDWKYATDAAICLSALELALGEVASAEVNARLSVTFADKTDEKRQQIVNRTNCAHVLHQAGQRGKAEELFRDAERLKNEQFPDKLIVSLEKDFWHCDLLLNSAERAAWRRVLNLPRIPLLSSALESCRKVHERAGQTLNWAEKNQLGAQTIAFDHLTLGRATLYAAILEGPAPDGLNDCRKHLQQVVDGLRRAGHRDYLPLGFLTRAWQRFLTDARTGPDSAQSDLDEAFEIAERGPMPLHIADTHLHRARLFGLSKDRPASYPWTSPQDDLAAARRLIEKHGYWRRTEELEDAEAAIREL